MSSTPGVGVRPDWALPPGVHALVTTRLGGVSRAPFDSLNLGTHVGDDLEAVRVNRERLRAQLPAAPRWLEQVHGKRVLDADLDTETGAADAVIASRSNVVCAIQTADCLPVLLTVDDGRAVGAAHAGWRGLQAGVIAAAVAALCSKASVEPARIRAYLGPAISGSAYEVGRDVRDALTLASPMAARAFTAKAAGADGSEKFWLDLYEIARQQLASLGVTRIAGGGDCTVRDADRFFSYRRDGRTGRFASLIWRAH